MANKYFTKSAFKIALECPWKLYYYCNSDIYANADSCDPFMQSLAEGGFQVGELAKIYCSVDEDADLKGVTDNSDAVNRTQQLLQREKVTIAEAAFLFENLFVRVDILRKNGNDIELIEVKAKSYNSETDFALVRDQANSNYSETNKVNPGFRDYIYDVAFQKYVVTNATSGYNVRASLMMADKTKTADRDGLNQAFMIEKNADNRTFVTQVGSVSKPYNPENQVITCMDVDDACNRIIAGTTTEQAQNEAIAKAQRDFDKAMADYQDKLKKTNRRKTPVAPVMKTPDIIENAWMQGLTFKDFITAASSAYCDDKRYPGSPILCGTCFKCQFQKKQPNDDGLLDGKAECWKNVADYRQRTMVENLNGASLQGKRGEWVREGKYYMEDIIDEIRAIIENKEKKEGDKVKSGLNYCRRQLLQIGLETQNQTVLDEYRSNLNGNTYLDVPGLREEMGKWKFPLHMIDFETTAVALPYYKGMHPYEQVAFQFSHHIIRQEGDYYTVEHIGQYINDEVSEFPNFKFVRELKDQLDKDNGTIFRYATHENSILCAIASQLEESNESDKQELIDFIRTITHNDNAKRGDAYTGDRDMVDLLDIVKRFFYNVDEMHGSNSIKQVLPAVLNCSQFLKDKYSNPIYGSFIKSRNIPADNPKAWVTLDENNHVESPYHLLEPVNELIDVTESQMAQMAKYADHDNEDGDFTVANGGEALTAYSKLMFCQGDKKMSDALRKALYRYCELDTMSMVFIWEYFNHESGRLKDLYSDNEKSMLCGDEKCF